MKRIICACFLCTVSVFLVSCSENLYSGSADKKTAQALQDEIDIAFIKSECAKVVQLLEPKVAFLTISEQYKYTNAKLCLSGMNITNIFDNIFDKNNNNPLDPFGMIQSFMGTSVLDNKTIESLRGSYKDVLSICTAPSTILDDSMKTVCGFAAAADTVLTISEIAMGVTGATTVNVTNDGLSGLLTANNITAEQIGNSLNALPPEKQNATLESITQNIEIVDSTVNVIEKTMPDIGDIGAQLDIFTNSLKDSTGNVTNTSLADFLITSIVKK